MANSALLTARQVETITDSGRHRVADNLYLEVERRSDRVYKRWRLRYQAAGVGKTVGLGSFPKVSYRAAKAKAHELMTSLRETGELPADVRDRKRAAGAADAKRVIAQRDTFKVIAEKYIDQIKCQEWKPGSKSRDQWESSLKTYVYPTIGALALDDINRDHILKILMPIWLDKHETADRVKDRVKSILNYAIETDARTLANPITETFEKVRLPRWTGEVVNFVALPYRELAEFWVDLGRRPASDSADVLRMIILTAQRQQDCRKATWVSIDLDRATWTVGLTKSTLGQAGRLHLVHLPGPLVDMLRGRLATKPKGEYVFDNSHYVMTGKKTRSNVISESAIRQLLGEMRYTDVFGRRITMHGFRSTFTDWVRENAIEATEIADMQLAHKIKDKTLAAYARGKVWDRRVKMMDVYAGFVTGCPVASQTLPHIS